MKNLFNFNMVAPSIEVIADKKDKNHKTFIIEPLEAGFGTTLGNALRRTALSSMPGGAITSIQIKGVPHEFSTIENVREDVVQIVLAVKNIIVAVDTDEVVELTINKNKKGPVTAGDIVCPPDVKIINPELVIANITKDKTEFNMKLVASRGIGYNVAEENGTGVKKSGIIFVDSIFTPVQKMTYETTNTRVGDKTNYDLLTIDVWTNGTITPEQAITLSSHIMTEKLNKLVNLEENLKNAKVFKEEEILVITDDEDNEMASESIEILDISTRAYNGLKKAGIATISDLTKLSKSELEKLDNIGKSSIDELDKKIKDLGHKFKDEQ